MKVMLVDDERLALMQLDKMLKEFGVDVLGSFMNPVEAVAEAGILQPDVVFLDIHMPELYGMEAAEAIQECCPSAEIVFITAYDEYAVKAFELNALDYLLKPLQRDRLERTIQRWRMRHTAEPAAEPADSLPLFCCFPNMRVERPGRGPELIKWRTSKAQELFAYLFHHRGQLVRKSTPLDLLWPATDERKANTHLYTTIYQIRQCLKQAGLHMPIHSIGMKEGYMLDVSHVRIDAEEWERQTNGSRCAP
ncbi:response regulator [Paenibacillus sp. P26]|nr:response regulator [Paenibacillus sp. P26]